MASDSDQGRPSFRFRQQFSRLKDKAKEKVLKRNITAFVHQNLTADGDDDSSSSRSIIRNYAHKYKEILQNKTQYQSLIGKIEERFEPQENITHPKGFYDSLFSPETANDVYLQTALISLWVIALLSILPTIIVIFLPSKDRPKKTSSSSRSTNMIVFHIFLCELLYLLYVLLAMINVAQDYQLAPRLCDLANYGMYVTIPIMQFALLFLSMERLSKHLDLSMTWIKIFTKPYLIQVILWAIWIILVAILSTFMFIRTRFSYNFVKDQAKNIAPPIVGDLIDKFGKRNHYHCSVDGRLSSVFKTIIIVLFIILIVKPILISVGLNLLTPCCCKSKRKQSQPQDERRTTAMVTIFLLLNFFFSFPFYFVSMFNSILTRIDDTRETFNIVLKICFILRITNIIFECFTFYTFERNSWHCITKVLYYVTCKKIPMLNDSLSPIEDPDIQAILRKVKTGIASDSDPNIEEFGEIETKRTRSSGHQSRDKTDIQHTQIKRPKNTSKVHVEDDDENSKAISNRRQRRAEPEKSSSDDEKYQAKAKTKQRTKVSTENENETNIPRSNKKPRTRRRNSDNDDDDGGPKMATTKHKADQTKRREVHYERHETQPFSVQQSASDSSSDASHVSVQRKSPLPTHRPKTKPKHSSHSNEKRSRPRTHSHHAESKRTHRTRKVLVTDEV